MTTYYSLSFLKERNKGFTRACEKQNDARPCKYMICYVFKRVLRSEDGDGNKNVKKNNYGFNK